jgi:hypothetical protein
MTFPNFSVGETLRSADMNAVGLWLTKTQAVGASAVSAVDVTSCFSADYDSYVIAFNGISVSGNMSLLFTLLSGSTPVSSGWVASEFFCSVGGTGLTGQLSNGAGGSAFCSAATASSGLASVVEIQSPFLVQYTHFTYSVADTAFYRFGFALHQSNTSYNGFRVTASSGITMTNGSISVYGRKK